MGKNNSDKNESVTIKSTDVSNLSAVLNMNESTPAPVETPAPTPEPTSAPTPAPTEAPVVVYKDTPVETLVTYPYGFPVTKSTLDLIAKVKTNGDQVVINSINSIMSYIKDMAPNQPMDTTSGARNQYLLFSAIKGIIDYSTIDFETGFVTLLRLFDEFKNFTFNERYLFRFTESLSMSLDDRKAFNQILNLLVLTAPVEGRSAAIKQVSFQKALQNSFTEEGKRKVLGFFNV